MKNLVFSFMAVVCLASLSFTGCGGSEPAVIEAPPATEEVDPATEGMSQEEYDKAMEESMNQ